MDALDRFPPSRAAALARLSEFLPHAGADYAARRNHEPASDAQSGVSMLSPYIRHRIITEMEVLSAVLQRFPLISAEKYVQEVFWRSYWKGWLEMRPGVWDQYRRSLAHRMNDLQSQSGLRRVWEDACNGQTGIDCFDHWARELTTTGWLHNHARMWFASIWIYTLRLPWELGADVFLRHLLDGDPASNTLSWRWVCGLQTQGKTYLARPDNISKFTGGRFHPEGLATDAPPLDGPPPPDRSSLPEAPPPDRSLRTGFLLHDEDLSPGFASDGLEVAATAILRSEHGLSPLRPAPHVTAFLDRAFEDAVARHGMSPDLVARSADEIAGWAKDHRLQQLLTCYAPVGPAATLLSEIEQTTGLPVVRQRRPYDSATWPHATHGFFRFRKHIPDLVVELEIGSAD